MNSNRCECGSQGADAAGSDDGSSDVWDWQVRKQLMFNNYRRRAELRVQQRESQATMQKKNQEKAVGRRWCNYHDVPGKR